MAGKSSQLVKYSQLAKSPQLWYETTPSTYSEEDKSTLRTKFKIPLDHRVRIPWSDQRPHVPPDGFTTFFYGQLAGGLRFPVPSFFTEVSNYFRIPLQQLTPNSIRLLCGVVVIFRFYHLPLNPVTFHYFFYPQKVNVGVFHFVARRSSKFLEKYPTSHKRWKTRYFFVKPACPFTWPTGWQRELPPQPDLGHFKDDATYHAAADVLIDLHFDGNLLLEESLLFYYGLSPVEAELKRPLADTMLRASCNKHMKWSRARLSAPVEHPEDSPAATCSAELPPPQPSMSLKVVYSSESEEEQFQFRPRKRGRDLKQPAEPSCSRRSATVSPSVTPPSHSPVATQPPPLESVPPTSPGSGISTGQNVPRRRGSPPLAGSLWEQIMATEEEAAKNKSIQALCDSMVVTNIKLLAEQRELTTRGPYLMERYRAMETRAAECQAQLENKNQELAQCKAEAAAHAEQIARLLAKLQESKQRRLASEMREAEVRGRREMLAAEVETLKEQLSKYKVDEEGQWASKKKAFLSSVEFYDILGARTVSMLKYGFEGAIRQVKKAGHLPKGTSLDFLDLQKVLDSIPDDELVD